MSKNKPRDLSEVNGSFSGADIIANLIFPGCNPITIGTASTITYSTYRETTPVRTISRINVKGFSKGQRTIAGTIIFTVLNKHLVNEIKSKVPYLRNIKKLKPDELPPFDILFTMGNEYGTTAHMALYGLTIVDEGKIFSIEDMFTENTWSYMARDIDLMDDIGSELGGPLAILGEYEGAAKYDKDKLVMDDDYVAIQKELDKIKEERDKYIEELRQQANEYIGNPSGWVPGQDVIVMTPGGSDIYISPEDNDINQENHPKLEIKTKKNHERSVFSKDTRNVCVVCEIDTSGIVTSTDVSKFKSAGVTLQSVMSCSCYDGKSRTKKPWEQPWKIEDKQMTVQFINYRQHTPEAPTIKVGVNKTEFKQGASEYALVGPQYVEIKNDNQGTKQNPIVFKFKAKGKNDANSNELENCTLKLTFSPTSITESPNKTGEGGKNVQFVFRDASNQAIVNKPPQACPDHPTGRPDHASFHTTMFVLPENIDIGMIKSDTIKALPREKLEGGFAVKAKLVDKDGKDYTGKTKKINIRCSYQVTIMDGTGRVHTVDGKNQNFNVFKIDEWFWGFLREGGKWDVSQWIDGFNMKPSVDFGDYSSYHFASWANGESIIEKIVMACHIHNDCPKRDRYGVDASVAADQCKCNMKHNQLKIKLYDFKLYDGDSQLSTKVTTNVSGNAIWFKCENLDEPAIKVFASMVKG